MTNPNQRKAVIYCRISSARQLKVGDGLRSQETRCREFARLKGYEVLEVFKDDVSGSMIERPAMKAMLAYVRKRRTDKVVVLIDDVSRLARGIEAHIELRGAIASAGGILESPSIEFGEDADSLLVEHLLASVSQHQRQKNGEQTKNRMRARMQNGYWTLQAPIGFRYESVRGRGKMLVRHEPLASIIQEALEGYASGRFDSQAEVQRFFQRNPLFPKNRAGIVTHNRVSRVLEQPLYAGYLQLPRWGIPLKQAAHEPLIDFATFTRIQQRINGAVYAPRRKNLNEDFPLRGFVLCDDCGETLTACWTKTKYKEHPYYLCFRKGCASYGKSIRREKIEGEFETLLNSMTPREGLLRVAARMFRDLWNEKLAKLDQEKKELRAQLAKLEKQVDQLLERIVDASVGSVIAAYEDKVRRLENDKALIVEKLRGDLMPMTSFERALRTSLEFLGNPWNLWASGGLEERRTLLKLAFSSHLRYARNSGFRTADFSLPFKLLGHNSGEKSEMARPKRFELLTPRFVVWCSIQLSYGRLSAGGCPAERRDPYIG